MGRMGAQYDRRPTYSAGMSTRRPSPLGGRRPTRDELADFATPDPDAIDDVLPDPRRGEELRLLIVGINPGLWTAAVNAPFARPGNRFWVSLARAGITDYPLDASRGLSRSDERMLAELGIGVTNLVSRPTARADELTRAELVAGGEHLVERVRVLRPQAVAILGITAFRAAYALPRAVLGEQPAGEIPQWPPRVQLWVLPNPSGLNAHETIDTIAAKWAQVWAAVTAG